MKLFKIIIIPLVLLFIFSQPLYSDAASPSKKDIEKADKLGEEFQKEMPWAKERQPQKELLTPVPPPPADTTESKTVQNPMCYNPYTGAFESCNPDDYEHFRLRWQSQKFRFWWEHGRACPAGYHFNPGWGCYRD